MQHLAPPGVVEALREQLEKKGCDLDKASWDPKTAKELGASVYCFRKMKDNGRLSPAVVDSIAKKQLGQRYGLNFKAVNAEESKFIPAKNATYHFRNKIFAQFLQLGGATFEYIFKPI